MKACIILFIISHNELYGDMPVDNGLHALIALKLAALLQRYKRNNNELDDEETHWLCEHGTQFVCHHDSVEANDMNLFEEKLLIAYGKFFRDGYSLANRFVAKAVVGADYEITKIEVSYNGLRLQTEEV